MLTAEMVDADPIEVAELDQLEGVDQGDHRRELSTAEMGAFAPPPTCEQMFDIVAVLLAN